MLDRKDFEVSAIVLENTTPPPERSVELPSTNNNNSDASLSSLANVLVDFEFARLL